MAAIAPAAALLILVMACNRGWLSRALSLGLFVFLGEISYSIYLLHGPMIEYVFSQWKAFIRPEWQLVTVIGGTLLVSTATYFLIEKPSRWLIRAAYAAVRRPAVMA